jgi:hypothetical protein
MIISLYVNAGMCSIIYPFAVFGYALLEETRPRRHFWTFMLWYTIFLLMAKFSWNLSILEHSITKNEAYLAINGYLHFGLRKYDSLVELTAYMLPELFIVFFITMNEIKLNMIGLFYQIEDDIEVLPDAFTRTIKGQNEELEDKKAVKNHMAMNIIFNGRD